MLWVIIQILFMISVVSSLSVIKQKLDKISKHLNIDDKEKDIPSNISNEEIEKELEKES